MTNWQDRNNRRRPKNPAAESVEELKNAALSEIGKLLDAPPRKQKRTNDDLENPDEGLLARIITYSAFRALSPAKPEDAKTWENITSELEATEKVLQGLKRSIRTERAAGLPDPFDAPTGEPTGSLDALATSLADHGGKVSALQGMVQSDSQTIRNDANDFFSALTGTLKTIGGLTERMHQGVKENTFTGHSRSGGGPRKPR